jgi:hypothetical protein
VSRFYASFADPAAFVNFHSIFLCHFALYDFSSECRRKRSYCCNSFFDMLATADSYPAQHQFRQKQGRVNGKGITGERQD